MSRVLYFDCFSGISGDMVLGACLDAGLPFDELKRALGSLAVSGFDLSARTVLRCGIAATKFDVLENGTGPVTDLAHSSVAADGAAAAWRGGIEGGHRHDHT